MSEFLWCQVSTKRSNDLHWKEGREGGGERKNRTVILQSRDNHPWLWLTPSLTEDSTAGGNFVTFVHPKSLLYVACLLGGRECLAIKPEQGSVTTPGAHCVPFPASWIGGQI